MKWRDMAEDSSKLHPDSQPQVGACYISDDDRFTVALVDAGDTSKGWAIWFVGGPTMRIASGVHLSSATQAQVLAQLLALAIRGVGLFLRGRAVVRAVLAHKPGAPPTASSPLDFTKARASRSSSKAGA